MQSRSARTPPPGQVEPPFLLPSRPICPKSTRGVERTVSLGAYRYRWPVRDQVDPGGPRWLFKSATWWSPAGQKKFSNIPCPLNGIERTHPMVTIQASTLISQSRHRAHPPSVTIQASTRTRPTASLSNSSMLGKLVASSSVHRQFIVSSLKMLMSSRWLTGFGRKIGDQFTASASNCLPLSKFASQLVMPSQRPAPSCRLPGRILSGSISASFILYRQTRRANRVGGLAEHFGRPAGSPPG